MRQSSPRQRTPSSLYSVAAPSLHPVSTHKQTNSYKTTHSREIHDSLAADRNRDQKKIEAKTLIYSEPSDKGSSLANKNQVTYVLCKLFMSVFVFKKFCRFSIVYLLARPLPAEPERHCTSPPRTSAAPPAPLTSGRVFCGKPGSASAAPLWTHTLGERVGTVQLNCGTKKKKTEEEGGGVPGSVYQSLVINSLFYSLLMLRLFPSDAP